MKDDFPHVHEALQYARDVVAGKIPACKLTIKACKRQLDDLKRKRWAYRFDFKLAERAVNFIQLLPHTKGKWASKRELVKLEPWQKFIITTVFGWVRKDGTRRYREMYVEVPRKNGKSLLASAIALYMLVLDGEYGAEVYSGATTEKQAWEVFKPCRQIALKTPELCEAFGLEVNAKALTIPETGAKLEPVIGNPGDGSSPSCAIVDEFHEHDSPNLYDTMITGMGARSQPLMVIITTAGSNIAGPCYDKRGDVIKILDGVFKNEETFGVIYSIDEDDDWTSVDALRKANPNFGVSVSAEFLQARQREAVLSSSRQNIFKTKHLNIWVSAKTGAFNMAHWNKMADPTLKREQFVDCPAVFAIDLASKIDIAANLQLFQRTVDGWTHYYVFANFYLPEETVLDTGTKNHAKYQAWHIDGYLTVTDGNEIQFSRIRDDITAMLAQYDVREIAFDPWRATQLAQDIGAEGATMVEYRNTVQLMSEPMKEIIAALQGGRLHHDGNPIMTWMMSNCVAKADAKDNIFPRKEKPENKIDGVVALIMAIGRALALEYQAPVQPSYLESDSLMIL